MQVAHGDLGAGLVAGAEAEGVLQPALDDLDAAERHIASLERGICLLGADVFRPDLDHLRGEIDERRRASPPTIHSA